MVPRKIIIDTDPGVDDILAILLAFSVLPEEIQVLLISVTYGNIDIQNCLRNVISLFYHVEKEVAWRESVGRRPGFEALRQSKPVVAVGSQHPLVENTVTADLFDGRDGLDGIYLSHPYLTPSETWQRLFDKAEKCSAPEQGELAEEMNKTDSLFTRSQTPAHLEILRLLHDNEPNSITIVAIGPLTNLALAAAQDPEIFLKVKEILVMGGNFDQAGNTGYQSLSHQQQIPNILEPPFRLIKQAPGPIRDSLNIRNQTMPIAEFNTYADPVAAARVYALTSPNPHTTMPPATPWTPLGQRENLPSPSSSSPSSFLPSSYTINLSKRLNITLFPLNITTPHTLTRDSFNTSLQPHLAAKSPLAEWVSEFMNATFEKIESSLLRPEDSRGGGEDVAEVQVQLHDPLTVWYCIDTADNNNDGGDVNKKKSAWKISEGEDLRVETAGRWRGGMFVANDNDSRSLPGGGGGGAGKEGGGNRISRCVGTPGPALFSRVLLGRIFGC